MSIFLKYFPKLNKTQLSQLNYLKKIYKDLNKNVNVISRRSIDNINVFHILHSLSINKIIEFKNNTNIMDLGTGGGFPGIPLAITNPNVNFTLVDSIKKKTDVVNTVSNMINLNNVRILNLRSENIEEKYDFIVSRAVTNMRKFLKLAKNKLHKKSINDLKNGIIYLKGGDLSDEMKGIIHNEYSISNFFTEDYFETKKIIYIKSI
jgi:16S rRNA (guanine527-N7)-methyltransferase